MAETEIRREEDEAQVPETGENVSGDALFSKLEGQMSDIYAHEGHLAEHPEIGEKAQELLEGLNKAEEENNNTLRTAEMRKTWIKETRKKIQNIQKKSNNTRR